jgi:zinc protease
MFAGTPYAHDALGTRPSFDKTTAADLKKFHDEWYAPNNAIMILVGDVDPQATLAKVKALFDDIPRKTLPARPVMKQQAQEAQRLSFDTDRPNGSVMLAMRLPGLDSPDFPALEILSDALASQRGALYQLVPAGKSLGTEFTISPLGTASVAYAAGAYAEGDDAKALEGELRAILADIAKKTGRPAKSVAASPCGAARA